jgi:hypothetical protein
MSVDYTLHVLYPNCNFPNLIPIEELVKVCILLNDYRHRHCGVDESEQKDSGWAIRVIAAARLTQSQDQIVTGVDLCGIGYCQSGDHHLNGYYPIKYTLTYIISSMNIGKETYHFDDHDLPFTINVLSLMCANLNDYRHQHLNLPADRVRDCMWRSRMISQAIALQAEGCVIRSIGTEGIQCDKKREDRRVGGVYIHINY